jgi:DNA topoisomerase I
LHAITLLARTPLPEPASEHAFKKEIAEVVKQVAVELRNTPAVCRKSYINPAVFDSWRSGSIHQNIDGKLTAASARAAETLVLGFLRQEGNGGDTLRRQPVLQRNSAPDDRPA